MLALIQTMTPWRGRVFFFFFVLFCFVLFFKLQSYTDDLSFHQHRMTVLYYVQWNGADLHQLQFWIMVWNFCLLLVFMIKKPNKGPSLHRLLNEQYKVEKGSVHLSLTKFYFFFSSFNVAFLTWSCSHLHQLEGFLPVLL